jgi:hypothetical protein
MILLPYEQGYLDGLCGIYSVINAVRLIKRNMREKEAMQLFERCMRHVEKRRSLGKVSTGGIDQYDLWSILRKCVIADYPINVERPFYNDGKIAVNDYFQQLRDYFEKDGKRTAIIFFECKDWDHWTAIRSITKKQITLFDSALMKRISIPRCVVTKPTREEPYLLTPEVTFYLYEK